MCTFVHGASVPEKCSARYNKTKSPTLRFFNRGAFTFLCFIRKGTSGNAPAYNAVPARMPGNVRIKDMDGKVDIKKDSNCGTINHYYNIVCENKREPEKKEPEKKPAPCCFPCCCFPCCCCIPIRKPEPRKEPEKKCCCCCCGGGGSGSPYGDGAGWLGDGGCGGNFGGGAGWPVGGGAGTPV